MDCTRTWDLLSAYLDGDLPARDQEEIADHLRRCPRCAEEERGLKETLSLLRDLPAEPAPPELQRAIRMRIGEETARTPLWRKLFLPAHIKIPLEVAAVVLIFVLAYGIQKEIPATKTITAPSASVESGKPKTAVGKRAERPAAGAARERRIDAAGPKTREIKTQGGTEGAAPPETERAFAARPLRERTPSAPAARLPAVPVTRVSTGGEAIEPSFPREAQPGEAPVFRVFAAPPSHLLRSMLSGREVMLDVSPDARAGMENRIAELAFRLGGAVRLERTRSTAGAPEATRTSSDLVQVHLPADSEDAFLKELGTLGTIPPEETPEREDLFSGPSSGSVVYTVRIRVR